MPARLLQTEISKIPDVPPKAPEIAQVDLKDTELETPELRRHVRERLKGRTKTKLTSLESVHLLLVDIVGEVIEERIAPTLAAVTELRHAVAACGASGLIEGDVKHLIDEAKSENKNLTLIGKSHHEVVRKCFECPNFQGALGTLGEDSDSLRDPRNRKNPSGLRTGRCVHPSTLGDRPEGRLVSSSQAEFFPKWCPMEGLYVENNKLVPILKRLKLGKGKKAVKMRIVGVKVTEIQMETMEGKVEAMGKMGMVRKKI